MQRITDWWKDAWKNSSLKGKLVFMILLSFSFTFIGLIVTQILFYFDDPNLGKNVMASLLGSIVTTVGAIRILTDDAISTGRTTQERITKLIQALESSTELISAIEQETKERQQLVTKLERDLATYNELVRLRKPEVEAVAQLLRGELRKEGRRGLWQEILVNGFFFVLGVVLTILTGIGG